MIQLHQIFDQVQLIILGQLKQNTSLFGRVLKRLDHILSRLDLALFHEVHQKLVEEELASSHLLVLVVEFV